MIGLNLDPVEVAKTQFEYARMQLAFALVHENVGAAIAVLCGAKPAEITRMLGQ